MQILVLDSTTRNLVLFRLPLLRAMREAGHQVTACAPDNLPPSIERLLAAGVQFRLLPLDRAGLNPFGDLRFLIRLVAFLRELRPRRMVNFALKPIIYGSLAARLAGVGHVSSVFTGLGHVFIEGSRGQPWLRRLVTRLLALSLRHNQVILFQNGDDRRVLTDAGLIRPRHRTMVVNGSGVDLEAFAQTPVDTTNPSFLMTARLLREKGLLEYVEAARLLKRKHPHLRFRLAGDLDPNPSGISATDLQAWRSEGAVECLGWLEDVRPALRACSVFVLPSYREGTPRSVLEAMATGRPIVTTDAPGCRETVRDGVNGFLVPVGNASKLAEAMERLILNPETIRTMGSRSRELAEEKFDVRRVTQQLLRGLELGAEGRGVAAPDPAPACTTNPENRQ